MGVAVHHASVAGSGTVLASRLRVADTHWARLRGLLGTTVNLQGIESWFAYVIALLFLLVRPQGLLGEKIIDRL